MHNDGTHWTRAQEGFLVLNWRKLTDAQIGIQIGRTEGAVNLRRLTLGYIRKAGGVCPKRESEWSEGKVIVRAEKFVESLGDIAINDKLWAIDRRIEEINVCLLRLFDSKPKKKKHFGQPESRALSKMRAMIRDLKRAREHVLIGFLMQSEAA